MGLSPVECVQIEIPIVNQRPCRPVAYDRGAEQIRFERPIFPVLQILEVPLYRLESVAAGTDDSDDHFQRAITETQALYGILQPSTNEHRPGLAADPRSAARSWWALRSNGPPMAGEDGGTGDCAQRSTIGSACSGQP